MPAKLKDLALLLCLGVLVNAAGPIATQGDAVPDAISLDYYGDVIAAYSC